MPPSWPKANIRTILTRLWILHWSVYLFLWFFFFLWPETIFPFITIFIPWFVLLIITSEILFSSHRQLHEGIAAFGFITLPIWVWSDLKNQGGWAFLFLGLALLCSKGAIEFCFETLRQDARSFKHKKNLCEEEIKKIEQERNFYQSKLPPILRQISSQRELSQFASAMGTMLDSNAILQKLYDKLVVVFPQDPVSIRTPNLSGDPYDHWLTEKKMSLWVASASHDPRFKSIAKLTDTQSIIAVPLFLEKSLVGMVRIDSQKINRFSEGDLQQLELYTHISNLAMENAQLVNKVNAMATLDGLTGLATHRVFQEKIQEEILRSARYHKPLSFVMVDIDHFKGVNDQYGHLAGDYVLQEVSELLRQSCRSVDFVARYGGEEFVMVLPEIDLSQCVAIAEELRRNIEQHSIQFNGQSFPITASLGCAVFPEDAQSAQALIRKADERLYKAKSQGRNRVVSE